MPRAKKNEPEIIDVPDDQMKRKSRPALSPAAREKQMVALAVDLAERQLRDGTAAASTINHYLKIGSTREFIEREILEEQKKLLTAKTGSIESSKRTEELYTDAIDAMRRYTPSTED